MFVLRRFFSLAALGGAAVGWLFACSSANPGAEVSGNTGAQNIGASCNASNPTVGCPCTTPGDSAECGHTQQLVDGNAVCSIGHTACVDGTWGACTAERVIVKAISTVSFANYGTAGACADPCTTYCSTTVDTPAGIAAPTGLVTDAGLTLAPIAQPANTCTSIQISPSTTPTSNIVITSLTTPTTKTYASALVPSGCNPSAPTPLYYTDKFDVAQMSSDTPGKLTIPVPIAGPITVSVALGKFTSSVVSNVTVAVAELGTSVNPPPSSATLAQFPTELATDPVDTKLETLYPYTGTVLPLGLPAPLLQWRNNATPADGGVMVTLRYPSTGTPVFQVDELVSENMLAPVPLRTAQPRYPFPQATWFAFEQTIHRNRATSGDTGRILIRRRIAGTTYASKFIDVRMAPGQLKGRIYYNSYGTALVKNYSGAKQSTGGAFASGSFGAATLVIPAGATAPTVAAGFDGSNGCYVCHSASADGTTLITGDPNHLSVKYTFPGTAPNGGTAYGTSKLSFAAINPGATRIFSGSGAADGDTSSKLYNIAGAAITTNVPTTLQGTYPSFATDGSAVAFTYRGGNAAPLSTLTTSGNTLSMMTFDGNATFSNFRNLVTPTVPAVWASFLPAGEGGIVYELETRTTPDGGFGLTRHDCECSTYSGATGEIWWVSTGTTATATRLHQANGWNAAGTVGAVPVTPTTGHAGVGGTIGPAGSAFYEQVYNYEPSVLPQVIGGYSWVMFTSRRAYGNVATINPYASDPRYDDISIDPTPKKLWMSAVSASPTAGTDPSAPAFYFPGQELIAGNSRAVFALDACHPAVASSGVATTANTCDTILDCCGGSASPATSACVLDPPPLANPPVKHCLVSSGNACNATGSSCLTTSNCCNAVSGDVCSNGTCTASPSYYTPQTFTRDYTSNCTPDTLTVWGLFDWQSRTPSDSSVTFSAQQGDGTTFTPTTPVKFATAKGADIVSPSWGTSGTKVSNALGTAGGSPGHVLRITMGFLPSTDKGQAPTLVDWRQSFQCVPAE